MSDAFDSIVPVSPATTISTSMPVSAVNSSSASLIVVSSVGNESYTTSVTAPGSSSEHADAVRARAPTAAVAPAMVGQGSCVEPS